MTTTKIDRLCKRCNTVKLIAEFGDNKSKDTKKQAWCKDCTNAYYKAWRTANRNKSKPVEEKQFETFYTTLHGRAVHMINNMRRRAKVKNLHVDIDVDWVESKLIVGVCEVTGIPFDIKVNGGKGHKTNSFSPSIDRIQQDGPYTKDNCRVTCWIYNRARGSFPPADFDIMLNALSELRD